MFYRRTQTKKSDWEEVEDLDRVPVVVGGEEVVGRVHLHEVDQVGDAGFVVLDTLKDLRLE